MRSKPRKPKAPKSTASIRKASMAEMEAFYAMRFQHYVAELDGEALGMGTLSLTKGRLWAWLDVKENLSPRQRVAVIWALIRGLRRVGQPVYVTSNESVHTRALDLLKAVGFRATGELVHGWQIWVYGYKAEEPMLNLEDAHDRA